jgi:hydroxymethylpyrimidine pyrophosphatase-like HAD family hydrolase
MDKKIFCIDLDGTLCTDGKDHTKHKPYKKRIAKINKLYDRGHKIIIDTARGSVTGKDWREFTEKQLKDWGVKYHILKVGTKTFADRYVDNKNILIKDFFK